MPEMWLCVVENTEKKFFSFSTIQDFDSHFKQSIPRVEILEQNIIDLTNYFLIDDDKINIYDIGCSTGRLLSKVIDKYNPKTNLIGIDKEVNLLQEIKNDRINILKIDLLKSFTFENACIIYSIFTLQFLPIYKRLEILKSIYNGLLKGGAFIFAEKVYSENSKIQDIFTFLYYDFKKESFTEEEIFNKEFSLRNQMKSLNIDENIKLLKMAGFSIVEIFFRQFNFVGFLCIK